MHVYNIYVYMYVFMFVCIQYIYIERGGRLMHLFGWLRILSDITCRSQSEEVALMNQISDVTLKQDVESEEEEEEEEQEDDDDDEWAWSSPRGNLTKIHNTANCQVRSLNI